MNSMFKELEVNKVQTYILFKYQPIDEIDATQCIDLKDQHMYGCVCTAYKNEISMHMHMSNEHM